MSDYKIDDVKTDFHLFDNIIGEVESRKTEEDDDELEFFGNNKDKEEGDVKFDMMEVDARESQVNSSQSVQVDNSDGPSTFCRTPNYSTQGFVDGSDDLTLDNFDGRVSESNVTDDRNSDRIDINVPAIATDDMDHIKPDSNELETDNSTDEKNQIENTITDKNTKVENSCKNEKESNTELSDTKTYEPEIENDIKLTVPATEVDDNSNDLSPRHLSFDSISPRDEFVSDKYFSDEDNQNIAHENVSRNREYQSENEEKDSKVLNDEDDTSNSNKLDKNKPLLETHDSFENIQIISDEKNNVDSILSEERVESKQEDEAEEQNSERYIHEPVMGQTHGNDNTAQLLEEIMNSFPAEMFSDTNEQKNEEDQEDGKIGDEENRAHSAENNEQIIDEDKQVFVNNEVGEPVEPKKKKKVVFERLEDTYDEEGDRRYDIRALELVSEDECEYVNLLEVQQARKDLSEYTMNLENFHNVISELEKPPEEKRKVEFDLEELLSETDETTTVDSDKKSPKSPKRFGKKKRKKKAANGGKVMLNKVCTHCNNPVIIKRNTYPKLDEIFSDSVQCASCGSTSSRELLRNKQKKKKNEEKVDEKDVLDSNLETRQNAAMKKWLKEKSIAEKKKRIQEKKERKQKAKESKQKKIKEEERAKRGKVKVEEWEERKRIEASEHKKKNNISASLKTDKLRPILHTKTSNGYSRNSSATNSPRSDVTFLVTEENSFEHFHRMSGNLPVHTSVEGFVQHVINEAVSELNREAYVKEARLKRPKSHAPQLHTKESNLPHPPALPKSANPRKNRHRDAGYLTQKTNLTEIKTASVSVKLLRSKTYDEWLTNKKMQRNVKAQEKEINEHYDNLQVKLIELEKERRHTLLELRQKSVQSYQTTKLPEISIRLEPQGSEAIKASSDELKR